VISLRRNHFLALAALYALAMVYSSLVLGPVGLHYVPLGPGEAWDKFMSVRFVQHGSNERPDWIANMLLPIPLAFVINSVFAFGAVAGRRAAGIAATLAISFAFILAVKYAQLYFPPRTVTLNYITAQLIGAVLGVIAFQLSHTRLYPRLLNRFADGDGLTIVLGGYTFFMIAYYLMPFDVTLSVGDLAARALELLNILFAIPGEGHPATYQLLLVAADTLTTIPIGMYLAVVGRERSTRSLVWRAFGLMFLIFFAQIFVMGTEPLLVALIYRTAGAVVGVLFIQRIKGKDLRKRHYYFSRYLPFAIPVYLLLVMFVSGVLSNQWLTFDEASNALEPRQFLPFWNFYIVSKARAAQSLVVGFFMFAPIGVMVWLRRGFWSSGGKFSAFLAFSLSLLMELGRMVKPGLRPDFSDPIIAAVAAAVAFKAMPFLWKMFEREAARSGSLDSYIAGLQEAEVTLLQQSRDLPGQAGNPVLE
jgi:VanZ family protein